jgi:hypothetical protein
MSGSNGNSLTETSAKESDLESSIFPSSPNIERNELPSLSELKISSDDEIDDSMIVIDKSPPRRSPSKARRGVQRKCDLQPASPAISRKQAPASSPIKRTDKSMKRGRRMKRSDDSSDSFRQKKRSRRVKKRRRAISFGEIVTESSKRIKFDSK